MPLTEWGMKFAKAIAECLKAPPLPQISEYNGITTEEARDNSRAIIPLPPKEKDFTHCTFNHKTFEDQLRDEIDEWRKDSAIPRKLNPSIGGEDSGSAIIPLPSREKDTILSCDHLKISQEQHERLYKQRKNFINQIINPTIKGDEDE